jgi:hypothetical protein
MGHNVSVCCVESCKYGPEVQSYKTSTQMPVFSYPGQRLHHLVGPVGVRPGRGLGGPPPHPGPPERPEGLGEPLPGWLPAKACLAGLLLLEGG